MSATDPFLTFSSDAINPPETITAQTVCHKVTIVETDATGLSLAITSSSCVTVLGITTVTITFNQNLPASDPINGPYVGINVTLLYPSV